MKIDTSSEPLTRLSLAGQFLPSDPCNATLYRWSKRGVSGVRLETLLIGGILYTSEQAIQRFIAETTEVRQREVVSA